MRLQLKAARINANLTAEAMANRIGVAEATVRNWESGRTTPKVDMLNRYCDECGVKVIDIILPCDLTKSLREV